MKGKPIALLLLRAAWALGLLVMSGSGLRKARAGAASTAPMISSLGAPFDRFPEVWAGAAMAAELVVPFFILFGFSTRLAAAFGAIHFGVATYAHLGAWGQPFIAVVFNENDPSGVGSLVWMAACLLILWQGPGRFSLDQCIEDGPDWNRKQKGE